MPPSRIFIVRHGEREDHKNPSYSITATRPHDPPLTPAGIKMAEALGSYMTQHYNIDPSTVVVLSSPLCRCIQTSDGIITGLQGSETGTIPIYVEPSIMEGCYWMFHDMKKSRVVVDPTTGSFSCPIPVYHDASYLKEHVSRHVVPEAPFVLREPPQVRVEGNTLVEADFHGRCRDAATSLLNSTPSSLDGKTVVLVGHGETVLQWLYAMLGQSKPDGLPNPNYTSFVFMNCSSDGDKVVVQPESMVFDTPHLPCPPSES